MYAETHSNIVPLVFWPPATPFCAKCAYFECLNLGVQSTLQSLRHCCGEGVQRLRLTQVLLIQDHPRFVAVYDAVAQEFQADF